MKHPFLIRFIRYAVFCVFLFILYWVLFNNVHVVGYFVFAFYKNPLYNDNFLFIYIHHFWLGLLILGCTVCIIWQIRKHKGD